MSFDLEIVSLRNTRDSAGGKDYTFVVVYNRADDKAILVTRWGKSGANGQYQVYPGECSKVQLEFQRKLREKTGRNYVEIGRLSAPSASSPRHPNIWKDQKWLESKVEADHWFDHVEGFARVKRDVEAERKVKAELAEQEKIAAKEAFLRDNFNIKEQAKEAAAIDVMATQLADDQWGIF